MDPLCVPYTANLQVFFHLIQASRLGRSDGQVKVGSLWTLYGPSMDTRVDPLWDLSVICWPSQSRRTFLAPLWTLYSLQTLYGPPMDPVWTPYITLIDPLWIRNVHPMDPV